MADKTSFLKVLRRLSLIAMLIGTGLLVIVICKVPCVLALDKRMMDYCDTLLKANTLRGVILRDILSVIGISSLIGVFPAGYWLLQNDTRNETKALSFTIMGALSLVLVIISLFPLKSIIASLRL